MTPQVRRVGPMLGQAYRGTVKDCEVLYEAQIHQVES